MALVMNKKVIIGILLSILIMGIVIFAYKRWDNRKVNEFCYNSMSEQIDTIEYNMNEIYIILNKVDYVKNSIHYNMDLEKLITPVDETLSAFQMLERTYREGYEDANTKIDDYIENNTNYDSYEEYYNYLAPIYSDAMGSEYIAKQMLDSVAYESNDTYFKANPDARNEEDFWDAVYESLIEKYKDNPELLFK